ncbi:MAG: HAMP domain-containing protein [Clostridiales Family XIII bacterium]|jgi:HAMP domain-containing protein|nr:HAMP domain-containing protein [Clostridiales Family XIII bacterium]
MKVLRRVGFIAIILFVSIVSLYILSPFITPTIQNSSSLIASDGKGGVYMSEADRYYSFVYHMDENGTVDACLKIPDYVTQAIRFDDSLYFIGESEYFGEEPAKWTLYEANASLDEYKVAASGGYGLIQTIYKLSSDAENIYLTAMSDENSYVCVLSWTPGKKAEDSGDMSTAQKALEYQTGGLDIFAQIPLKKGDVAIDAVCDGESVYAWLENGAIARMQEIETTYMSEIYLDIVLSCEDGIVSFADNVEHKLWLQREFLDFDLARAYDGRDARALTIWDGHVALLAIGAADRAEISFSAFGTGAVWSDVTDIKLLSAMDLVFVSPKADEINIIVIFIASIIILAAAFSIFSGRPVIRVSATFIVLGAFMLAVMCFAVWYAVELAISTEANTFADPLNRADIIADEKNLQIEAMFDAFIPGVIGLAVATVAAIISIRWSLRPLRALARQIDRFTQGDFEVDGTVRAKGELGNIHRAVSEMGVSLAIKQYETDRMINSFHRFAPRGVSKLLGRAGIMEISSGDVTTIDDCVAIVSVENREKVLRGTDNSRFMTFVNLCFSKIYECVNNHNGLLLSGDFDLSSLPVLFSLRGGSSRGDALRFGLDLIDHMGDGQVGAHDEESGLPSPAFFLMLHKTEFIYGIAGTEQKAFPFVSSAELNFLGTYNKRLWSLGIRMVATEQFIEELSKYGVAIESLTPWRYIGLFSTEDGAKNYKLYEMLGCFSDKERDLRLNYNERLQSAIRLFYKNDFYPAMVEFSSLLKLNPKDGLVRWYVFACEKYFNEGDVTKVRYNLFGAEEE